MSVPSTVTNRAEGNEFIANTGMLLSGFTGFTIRTGFYLTNSGNYPISTSMTRQDTFVDTYDFPSGLETPIKILAGESKFIPFDFTATVNSVSGPVDQATSTGPDHNGLFVSQLTLNIVSEYDGQTDPEGSIVINITGQVTGGPVISQELPSKPSGFLAKSSYGTNGKPHTELQWQHPSSGYYLSRYKIDSATNIDTDTSSATGTWSTVGYFNIKYEDISVPSNQNGGGYWTATTLHVRKYATPTGIAQLYQREEGVLPNLETSYGQTGVTRSFGSDYYYRIQSQFISQVPGIQPGSNESPWVYAYPVTDFTQDVPADVGAGLESGNTTLPSSSSSNIKIEAQDPQSLDIYLGNGTENINLSGAMEDAFTTLGVDINYMTTGHSNFTYSGIKWIVPQGAVVGSSDSTKAAIDTGKRLMNSAATDLSPAQLAKELTGVLILEENSMVMGMGGKGGDGGHVSIEQFNVNPTIPEDSQRLEIGPITDSTAGSDGSAAIRISDANIDNFTITKAQNALIAGGGGGGGAGDPFIQPKIKNLKTNKLTQIAFNGIIPNLEGGGNKGVTNTGTMFRKGKLSRGLHKNPDTSKETIQIEVVGAKMLGANVPGNGMPIWYPVEFSIGDIIGSHDGGVGGGGQGFGLSYPGTFLRTGEVSINSLLRGSAAKVGLGSDSAIKKSAGATGGGIGLDGGNGISIDFDDFFQPDADVDADQTLATAGGKAGRALDATGNSNYTRANFRSKLLTVGLTSSPSLAISSFDEVGGFVAHFDASQNVYEDAAGTDDAEDGDAVKRWNSVNDPTKIYMVQYDASSAASSAPTYQKNNTAHPAGYFSNKTCVHFDTNLGQHNSLDVTAVDKRLKIKGVTGAGKLESAMDGFDIFYYLVPMSYVDYNWYYNSGQFIWSRVPWAWSSSANEGTWSYSTQSQFFTKAGSALDNTGVGYGNTIEAYQEAFKYPDNRAYIWNVSNEKVGSLFLGNIHRDGLNISTKYFSVADQLYSFIDEPILGGPSNEATTIGNMPLYIETSHQWKGGIGQILIYNRKLKREEREAVTNLLNNKELKIQTIIPSQIPDYTDTQKKYLDKNREKFRNKLSDGNGFGGFIVFDS